MLNRVTGRAIWKQTRGKDILSEKVKAALLNFFCKYTFKSIFSGLSLTTANESISIFTTKYNFTINEYNTYCHHFDQFNCEFQGF